MMIEKMKMVVEVAKLEAEIRGRTDVLERFIKALNTRCVLDFAVVVNEVRDETLGMIEVLQEKADAVRQEVERGMKG